MWKSITGQKTINREKNKDLYSVQTFVSAKQIAIIGRFICLIIYMLVGSLAWVAPFVRILKEIRKIAKLV